MREQPSRAKANKTPQELRTARIRLLVVGVCFVAAYFAIIVRLGELSFSHDAAKKTQSAAADPTNSLRAEIRDRNGVLLATTLHTASVFADPAEVQNPKDAAEKLATVLTDVSKEDLYRNLSAEKRFVWLKRNVTPRQEYDINKLGIPGVDFRYEDRRIYPMGDLAAHAVGYTDRDGNGIAGIEKFFDERLKNNPEPLILSLDARLQHILRREADNAKENFNGIGAAGLIMNINTGEVLAMVSLPDFDPNNPGDKQYSDLDFNPKFNRTTLGVYEMGSTFKMLTVAAALESGKVKLTDKFDASKPLVIGKYQIHDYEKMGRALSVPEIIQYSSNIGTARMAMVLGTDMQRSFLATLGLLEPAKLEVPELGRPLLPKPWNETATMTVAFGHGIAITPVQMMTAECAVSDGGFLHPPTLLKVDNTDKVPSKRIISPETSEKVRQLMRLVVTDGTGKKAAVPGYLIGGKTGTAEKVNGHGYNKHALISSFVGAFPMNDPQYLVAIMVDEPKPNKTSYGFATGGWVAAPSVGNVISEIGPLLGVQPVDEKDPKIIEAMRIPGYTPESQMPKKELPVASKPH